jgi:hypothetical protein
MKARRIAASVAAAVIIAGGVSLAAAPAASASGTVSITTNCDGDLTLFANPGDTILITMGTGCLNAYGFLASYAADANGFLSYGSSANSVFTGVTSVDFWWVIANGLGTTTATSHLMAMDSQDNPLEVGSTVAIVGNNDSGAGYFEAYVYYGGPRSDDATPIPPWVQGYGRGSASDTCKDGWTASWELWPHGGQGGWVCTRAIPSLG